MKRSQPLALLTVLAAVFTLSACGVDEAQTQACNTAGGTVMKRQWATGETGFFARRHTHEWTYCGDYAGNVITMYEVYGQEPGDADEDFWSNEGAYTRRCQDNGGEAWHKFESKYSSYICIIKGQVTSPGVNVKGD